ncbi:MAG: hypothetical protein Ct9H300mP27_08280 [Chloroflexota bacterium]|nr:MAG: hypothetical protein Ct9H300mP27_08280 [Chloroflexota bacterium]
MDCSRDSFQSANERSDWVRWIRSGYKDCLIARSHTFGLIGPDGRVKPHPMWFDYEGDRVLINTAAHRRKCGWIRNNPQLTLLIVNPDNPYHWVQIKCTVDAKNWKMLLTAIGLRASWTKLEKYTGNEPPYGLRDPLLTRKGCFLLSNDRVATFGKP